MGRRAARPCERPRSSWPLFAGGAVIIIAAAGWWLAASPRSPLAPVATAGTSLVSYRPPDVHALVVAPEDERTVLFGSHAGILLSRDGGATWSKVPNANGDAMGIAVPPGSTTA